MRLGLPPSPSHDVARANAPLLARVLSATIPDITVDVAESYGALGDELLAKTLEIAWAPPIVCARVEMAGGRAVLRAVRSGMTSYRAGLVCRVLDEPDLARPGDLVAAWVDQDSAAGYLLARSWLAARKIDALQAFKSALFVGSYVSALQAVAEKRADIASIFVTPAGAPAHSTLDEVDDALRRKLRVFATTGETQTDGVVTAPGADEARMAPIIAALSALVKDAEGAVVMKTLFACDELKKAPERPTSTALRDLVAHNERTRARPY